MENQPGRISNTHNTEHYTWGEACDGWHFLKTGNLSVIRERMPKDRAEKLHYHEKSEQFFYILSGEATFEVETVKYIVRAGEGISIKPGEKHQVSNNAGSDLEFIVISSPMAHGDRINIE